MKRWSTSKILALLVVGNLFLGGALFAFRSPSGNPTEASAPPSQLPAQVQELQARIAAGRHGEPYTLDLSDEELTATARYFLARAPNIPFTRVSIIVVEDKLVVNGVTKGLAVAVPVRLTAAVSAQDGRPRTRVENVSLGDSPLPDFVRQQIVREADASLDLSRYNIPVAVDTLELRPGGLMIRGTIR